MRELLEFGEFEHQREDRADVSGCGRADQRAHHASSGASDKTISIPPKRDATQLYAWHAIHRRTKPRIALSSSALVTVLSSTEPKRKNATSTPSSTIGTLKVRYTRISAFAVCPGAMEEICFFIEGKPRLSMIGSECRGGACQSCPPSDESVEGNDVHFVAGVDVGAVVFEHDEAVCFAHRTEHARPLRAGGDYAPEAGVVTRRDAALKFGAA